MDIGAGRVTVEGSPADSDNGLPHLYASTNSVQVISRLVKRLQLIRAERDIYFCPIKSRLGTHGPSMELAIKALAEQRGETIVPNGGAAAN